MCCHMKRTLNLCWLPTKKADKKRSDGTSCRSPPSRRRATKVRFKFAGLESGHETGSGFSTFIERKILKNFLLQKEGCRSFKKNVCEKKVSKTKGCFLHQNVVFPAGNFSSMRLSLLVDRSGGAKAKDKDEANGRWRFS